MTGNDGSRLDLHGELYHPTWTRLAAHIPGSTQVETTAPAARNTELFLQECVNWPEGGEIIVTTSRAKDTRGHNYNSEGVIASGGVACVTVDGKTFGKITLTQPVEHYHHAGDEEYQCEVALLTRNIKIRGTMTFSPFDRFYFARLLTPVLLLCWRARATCITSHCPKFRADRRTFGIIVSKLGLQATTSRSPPTSRRWNATA